MTRLIFLIGLIGCTAVNAAPLYPPEKYDHPYNGRHTTHVVNPSEVKKICVNQLGWTHNPKWVEGCAWVSSDGHCWNIVSGRPRHAESVEALMRHERAHCNGWKHE